MLVLKKVFKIRKANINAVKVERIVRIKKLIIQSFIEAVDGGNELKDSVGVYFVLLFLYLFSFFFSFWYFIMCFCFNGDKKLYEDVDFNSNIKDGIDGDELLQVSNFVCSFFFI